MIKILQATGDFDRIMQKVIQMGPEPVVNLPDELVRLNVSVYLPLAKLLQLVSAYGPLQAATKPQRTCVAGYMGLLIGKYKSFHTIFFLIFDLYAI